MRKELRKEDDEIFYKVDDRICNRCKRFNEKNQYCYILRHKIEVPEYPYCSWFVLDNEIQINYNINNKNRERRTHDYTQEKN